ncbi:MAG: nitrile hydratase accessory protein [Burkholderiales bacterium]|nr:nitrile hydratase accessory protein [Burkholderiales bacterium]
MSAGGLRMERQEDVLVDPRLAETLPRRSGEISFRAPWEKRVFGIVAALCQQGRFPFDDFRWRVVSEIMMWQQASGGKEENFHFWERWLRALERTLVDRTLLSWEEISQRAGQAQHRGERDATQA